MLSFFFAVQLLCAHTVLTTAMPAPGAGPASSDPAGRRIVQLERRSFRQPPPNSVMAIFPVEVFNHEVKNVIFKYREATELLSKVILPLQPGFDIPTVDDLPPPPNSSTSESLTVGASDSISPTPNATASVTEHISDTDFLPPVLINPQTGLLGLKDFIYDDLDLVYYGPVNIGTPAQTLTVDVDTGSADLWFAVRCPHYANRQFDSSRSSTYTDRRTPFSVTYGSGDVSGTLATESVSIAGFTVQNQTFGAVDHVSSDFNYYPNDGLIGMAFSSISSSGELTFFENLIQERKVARPVFSVHLSRHQATGSQVCFGCYDEAKTTGPVTWVPVRSKTYWSVSMDGMLFAGQKLETKLVAAIDTGTTLIYVPAEIATGFYKLIPGARQAKEFGSEYYAYPCGTSLDIALSFDARPFTINSRDFNLGRINSSSTECIGGILGLSGDFSPNLAIVGDEFLKSWYTTFDYSGGARVGFSPSINNK